MAQCNIERCGSSESGGGFITVDEIQSEWTQVSLGDKSKPKMTCEYPTTSSKYMVALLNNNIYSDSAIIFTHASANSNRTYYITIGDPDAGYDRDGYIQLNNMMIYCSFDITTSTGNSLVIPRNNSLYVKEYT